MDKPISEMLIYVLIAGIVLVNYLRPLITRWLKQQQALARAPQPLQQSIAVIDRDLQSSTTAHLPSGAPTVRDRQRETVAVSAALQHRTAARLYLANRSKLRQAIITATVLGPCRAQEPPDRRE